MNSDGPLTSHPMLIVACPLCDAEAAFDAQAGALACDACGVQLDIAPDAPEPLPLAA